MEGSTPLTIVFGLGFIALWWKLGGLGRKIRGVGKQVMTLQEAISGVESAVTGIGTAVADVQTSVNEVIEDLRNSGASQESIDRLVAAANSLGEITANANTAATTLREADPTPATPAEPPTE